jgi:cell division protein ZipA
VPEFRWILLGLGLLLLGGIWWWGSRRPTQARGHSELREVEPSSNFSTTVIAEDSLTMTLDAPIPAAAAFSANPIVREPSISPYEPLRISTHEPAATHGAAMHGAAMHGVVTPGVATPGEFDLPVMAEPAVDSQVLQIDDVQMLVASTTVDPAASTTLLSSDARLAEPRPREPGAAPRTDTSGRFSRVRAPELKPEKAKPVELQKIVAVRICAVAGTLWDGTDLATALTGSDLVHGRYGVFHRLHTDGRSIFCIASLVEPGSFDPARMPEQRFPGISIFAVLPGPVEPVQTFEEMMATARQLAQDLSGMMQDEKGGPLSPQRVGSLREEVVRFQQLLQAEAAN